MTTETTYPYASPRHSFPKSHLPTNSSTLDESRVPLQHDESKLGSMSLKRPSKPLIARTFEISVPLPHTVPLPLPLPPALRSTLYPLVHAPSTKQFTMPKAAVDKKVEVEKKRKSKKAKDPNKPKRALSAYMFFVQDHRDNIKSENPDVSFGEVGKLLGAKWKEMTPAEKKPYEDKAEADKTRAAKEKAAYGK